MKFKKYIVAAAIVVAAAVVTVEAAQVYSWVDEKGVTHYSQQPPRENNNAQFSMIDTVFSPSEQNRRQNRRIRKLFEDARICITKRSATTDVKSKIHT